MEVEEATGVGNRYQTMTGEDAADWKILVPSVVKCRMCESLMVL
jgi:hypothetical protein